MLKTLVTIITLFSLSVTAAFADSSATATNTAGAQSIVNGVNPTAISGSQAVIRDINQSAKVGDVSAGIGNVEAGVTINSAPSRYQDFPNTVQAQPVNLGLGGYTGPYEKGWNVITMPWLLRETFDKGSLELFEETNGSPDGDAEVVLFSKNTNNLNENFSVNMLNSSAKTIEEKMAFLREIKKNFEIVGNIDVHSDDEDVSLSHLFFKALKENFKKVGATYMVILAGYNQASKVSGWSVGLGLNTSLLEKANPASVGGNGSFGAGVGSIKGRPESHGFLAVLCLKPKNASMK